MLLLDAAQIQNWEAAMKFLEQLESVVDGRSAQNWIRLAYLLKARENEEARELAMAILKSTANVLSQGDLFRAVHVLSHLNSVVDRNEMLALLDAAKPVFDRQPEQVDGPRQWKQRRAAALSALGRVDEALLLYRDIATTGPWDFQAQATLRVATGDHRRVSGGANMAAKAIRPRYEIQRLRTAVSAQQLCGDSQAGISR